MSGGVSLLAALRCRDDAAIDDELSDGDDLHFDVLWPDGPPENLTASVVLERMEALGVTVEVDVFIDGDLDGAATIQLAPTAFVIESDRSAA